MIMLRGEPGLVTAGWTILYDFLVSVLSLDLMVKRSFAEQARGWTSWSELVFSKKLRSYRWILGDEVVCRIKGRKDDYS